MDIKQLNEELSKVLNEIYDNTALNFVNARITQNDELVNKRMNSKPYDELPLEDEILAKKITNSIGLFNKRTLRKLKTLHPEYFDNNGEILPEKFHALMRGEFDNELGFNN